MNDINEPKIHLTETHTIVEYPQPVDCSTLTEKERMPRCPKCWLWDKDPDRRCKISPYRGSRTMNEEKRLELILEATATGPLSVDVIEALSRGLELEAMQTLVKNCKDLTLSSRKCVRAHLVMVDE